MSISTHLACVTAENPTNSMDCLRWWYSSLVDVYQYSPCLCDSREPHHLHGLFETAVFLSLVDVYQYSPCLCDCREPHHLDRLFEMAVFLSLVDVYQYSPCLCDSREPHHLHGLFETAVFLSLINVFKVVAVTLYRKTLLCMRKKGL